jgi:hypothetical protein
VNISKTEVSKASKILKSLKQENLKGLLILVGPLRFELKSQDPQSCRMARLPYGPAEVVLF